MDISVLNEHIEYQKAYNSWCKKLFSSPHEDLSRAARSVSLLSGLKYFFFGPDSDKETSQWAKRDAARAILDVRGKDTAKGTGSLDSILVTVEEINSNLPPFPYADAEPMQRYFDMDDLY